MLRAFGAVKAARQARQSLRFCTTRPYSQILLRLTPSRLLWSRALSLNIRRLDFDDPHAHSRVDDFSYCAREFFRRANTSLSKVLVFVLCRFAEKRH